MSDPVRRLGLRIDHIDWAFDPAGLEIVTILVDDQELLSRVGGQDYLGWDPAAILDPDLAPLLPVQPARRVGLYGQATFCHAEEGCIAAILQDRGEHVVWKDLREFWSEYLRPTTEQDPDPQRGEHTGIPDVVFDAAQYRAEIARVSEGLPWETEMVTTLRLFRRSLRRMTDYLARFGWKLEFASPGREGIWIALRDDLKAQTIVELHPGPGTPAEQAAAMTDFLVSTPPEQWPVAECSRCDARDDPDHGRQGLATARHPAHEPSAGAAWQRSAEGEQRGAG